MIRFLSVADVCVLHETTLRRDGGLGGVKHPGLLEAAVAMPRQQFDGDYLHGTVPLMAAAYMFHLCMNHAFNDGNKRVAAFSAWVFADTNGFDVGLDEDTFEQLTMDVAAGVIGKSELTAVFERVVVVGG